MRYTLLALVLIVCISCEKLLEVDDDRIGTIDNEVELSEAIHGIYSLFSEVFADYDYHMVFVLADDINWTNRTSGMDIENPSRSIYINLYKTVISSNNLILQEGEFEDFPQAQTCIGEAYFIRAMCYFYLVRLYGEIPLVRDIEVKWDNERATTAEIYASIENDLLHAIQSLPKNNESSRIPYVTPHRGSAKAMLAEVYLNMAGWPLKDTEKYEMAALYAGEVIDSSEHYQMALLEDMSTLWVLDNFENREKIFGVHIPGRISTPRDEFCRSEAGFYMGESYERHSICAQRSLIPEINFYNAFPYSYRKKVSFHMGYYTPEVYSIDGEDYSWFRIVEINRTNKIEQIEDYIRYRKWLLNAYHEPVAFYLYRYAHTLLTYAEAKARSNELDASAYEAANMIRRRANQVNIYESSPYDLPAELSPEAFADSIIQERAWEFCIEHEGRWFDLLRTEKLEEVLLARFMWEPEVSWLKSPIEANYFLDIPQEDIWLNPNLEDSE